MEDSDRNESDDRFPYPLPDQNQNSKSALDHKLCRRYNKDGFIKNALDFQAGGRGFAEMYPECVIAPWDTLVLLLDA